MGFVFLFILIFGNLRAYNEPWTLIPLFFRHPVYEIYTTGSWNKFLSAFYFWSIPPKYSISCSNKYLCNTNFSSNYGQNIFPDDFSRYLRLIAGWELEGNNRRLHEMPQPRTQFYRFTERRKIKQNQHTLVIIIIV